MAHDDRKHRLLGSTFIHRLDLEELNDVISQGIISNDKLVIGHHNLHSLYLYQRDLSMKAFYKQAALVPIDGMSLVWLGRTLGLPLERRHRVTYVDWTHPLVSMVEKRGWRLFYLGSKPGVAEKGAGILRRQYPRLNMKVHHGYFNPHPDSAENQRVLEQIAHYEPHILMVGMGMPRQERWVHENWDQICANVVLTSGACIDYIAGTVPTPPRWMGQAGLEWLHRLFSEPRRLAKRYLWEPWFLLPLFLREWSRSRLSKGASSSQARNSIST